jgi:hypothetical protein
VNDGTTRTHGTIEDLQAKRGDHWEIASHSAVGAAKSQNKRSSMRVVVPAIVWCPGNAIGLEYGMMGSVKAFSIHYYLNRYTLSPRLHKAAGVPYPVEEFRSPEQARRRAEEIREDWRQALARPYDGPRRRVP